MMMIHYYQPLHGTFPAKIIVSTSLFAVAGIAKFTFCPSAIGCRAAVMVLSDLVSQDYPQNIYLSGSSLGLTIEMPQGKSLWIVSET